MIYFYRARQLNHARNIWDRAITILPRANQFWYKYTYMEEMLGHIAGEEFFFENLIGEKYFIIVSFRFSVLIDQWKTK